MLVSNFTVSDLPRENRERQVRGRVRGTEFQLVLTSIFRLKRLRWH